MDERKCLQQRPAACSSQIDAWHAERVVRVVSQALHGSIYNDGWFGSGAAWSADESKLAYVAEAPPPAKTPEWGARLGPDGKKAEGAGPKGWRGVGEWSEDWGELNTGAWGWRGQAACCEVGGVWWGPGAGTCPGPCLLMQKGRVDLTCRQLPTPLTIGGGCRQAAAHAVCVELRQLGGDGSAGATRRRKLRPAGVEPRG